VNYSYQKYLLRNNNNSSKGKMLLQKIEPKLSKEIQKKQNLDWFESKLYEVFSKDVSCKYSLYNKDYNRAQINLLFIRNEPKEIIDFLKKPIKSIYEDYINNKKVEGFETLKEDLKNLKKKMIEQKEENIDNYIKKYKLIAENLELIFKRKSSRNNKKQKK
jgi:N-formylglutamate amidohydrolase